MWSELWPAPILVMYLGLCGYGVLKYLSYRANRGKQSGNIRGSINWIIWCTAYWVWPSVRSTIPQKSKNVKRVSLQKDPFYNHMGGNRNCLGSLEDRYLPVPRSALWSFRIFRYNITQELCQQYQLFLYYFFIPTQQLWEMKILTVKNINI